MKFKKGISGNPNGRPKGAVNKNKAIVTSFIDININKNFQRFQSELDKLNGKEFINVFMKMAKIMTHDNSSLMANKKMVELFNQKIKTHIEHENKQ